MATVEDILMAKGPDVIVAAADTAVREAAKMMAQANVGSVIILEDSRPAGIFTERDLLRRVVAPGRGTDETTLGEVMSSPVRSVGLDDDVAACAEVLAAEHIRHLAVVEQDALIGLISYRDVTRARFSGAAEETEAPANQAV